MRAFVAVLSTLVVMNIFATAQHRELDDGGGARTTIVAAVPASDAARGTLLPSCTGAVTGGCLDGDRQRALLLLGFMSGARRPAGLR